MKLQIPTSPTLNRALAGGFACAALALATGCQTVKKAAPKFALKPKVERKILDPRENVPSPYVKPRAIVKVRPDGAPTPRQAVMPRMEAGSSIIGNSEPVAFDRAIPFHAQSIIATTAVTSAEVQQQGFPTATAVTLEPTVATAAPAVRQTGSFLQAGIAPVFEPTSLERDTAIQAIAISPASSGRVLGGIAPVAIAVAPAPAPTEIVLQELPQENEVAVTALANINTFDTVVEPANSLFPPAMAATAVQGVDLGAAPVDLGQAPAEVEPLPTFAFKPMTYAVVKGDSLWKIGHAHGVSVAEIASFNNLNASRPLKIGQSIELPPGAKFIPSAQRPQVKRSLPAAAAVVKSSSRTPKSTKRMPSGNTHSVVSGDSLSLIAQTYGVSVNQLCKLNGLTRQSVLQLKQVVKLGEVAKAPSATQVAAIKPRPIKVKPVVAASITPEPAEDPEPLVVATPVIGTPPAAAAVTVDISQLKTLPHVVGQNDTLEIISGMYNSTPEWIKEANDGLTNNSDLTSAFKGKEITVPCRGIEP
ncbi:MAG: LysM repeat protein [Rhodothermales bacterium]|jgi:LysM repeat protein